MTIEIINIIKRMSDAELVLYAQIGGTFPRLMMWRVARLVEADMRREDNLGDAPPTEPAEKVAAA